MESGIGRAIRHAVQSQRIRPRRGEKPSDQRVCLVNRGPFLMTCTRVRRGAPRPKSSFQPVDDDAGLDLWPIGPLCLCQFNKPFGVLLVLASILSRYAWNDMTRL